MIRNLIIISFKMFLFLFFLFFSVKFNFAFIKKWEGKGKLSPSTVFFLAHFFIYYVYHDIRKYG